VTDVVEGQGWLLNRIPQHGVRKLPQQRRRGEQRGGVSPPAGPAKGDAVGEVHAGSLVGQRQRRADHWSAVLGWRSTHLGLVQRGAFAVDVPVAH
jgi:hypothetical protein